MQTSTFCATYRCSSKQLAQVEAGMQAGSLNRNYCQVYNKCYSEWWPGEHILEY